MALDRQSIERRDFPIARRGYEIEAVDAHLGVLADEFESVARRGRGAAGGLAASASEQVRMIVEAAEQSAADIERDADLEARQLRQDAREEAERLRADAGRQARDHVNRVAEVARGLLDRIESMDRELGTLLDGLRTGTQRLSADLSLLQASVGEIREVAQPRPGIVEESESSGDAAIESPGGADASGGEEPDPAVQPLPFDEPAVSSPGEAVADTEGGDLPPDEPAAPGEAAGGRATAERDGARMVALNMALNGVTRADTQHHLEENFDIDDVEAMLDDVYARAGR